MSIRMLFVGGLHHGRTFLVGSAMGKYIIDGATYAKVGLKFSLGSLEVKGEYFQADEMTLDESSRAALALLISYALLGDRKG